MQKEKKSYQYMDEKCRCRATFREEAELIANSRRNLPIPGIEKYNIAFVKEVKKKLGIFK